MANDNIIKTISVDTSDATKSVGELQDQFDSLAKSEKAASDAGEKFAFTNDELIQMSGRYTSSLKDMQTQVEQTTGEIQSGFMAAAAVANSAAVGINTDYQVMQAGGQNVVATLGQSRVAFMDLGRIITGQGLSLRNLTSSFTLLSNPIVIATVAVAALGVELYKSYQYYQDLNDITKQYNKVLDESAAAQAESVVNVQKMGDIFDEANKGLVSQTDALNEYNKEFGDTIGKAKSFSEAEQLFISRSPAYVQAMKQRAIANAAFKLEQEALTEQIKNDADGLANFWQRTDVFFTKIFQGEKEGQAVRSAIISKNHEDNETLIDQYSKIAKAADDAAAAIDKASGINTLGTGKTDQKQDQQRQKALQDEKAFIDKINEIDESAQEKETQKLTEEYQKRLAELQKFHLSTTTLTEAYLQGLANIQDKYGAKEDEYFDKAQNEHVKRQEKIRQDEAKGLEELSKLEEQYLIKSEKDQGQAAAAAIRAEDDKYNKIVQMAKLEISNQEQLNKTLEQLAKQHAANIADIQAKAFEAESKKQAEWFAKDRQIILNSQKTSYTDKEKALKQDQALLDMAYDDGELSDQDYTKATEQNAKDRTAVRNQELQTYESISQSLGQMQTALTNLGAQNTVAAKALGLAQIAISSGVAVAKAVAAASDLPFPANLAAIAASVAVVLADIASANKLLNSANVPGGSTTTSSAGGGAIGQFSTTSYAAPSIPATTNVTSISQRSIDQLQTQQAPVRAYVVESDITTAQQTVSQYRNNSRI